MALDDAIGCPASTRGRAIAGAGIALWLLWQVALPLSYYWRDDAGEERFAWRMFSDIALFHRSCAVSVTERVRAPVSPAGPSERAVDLPRSMNAAWENHLRRARAIVVEKLLRWRCARDPAVSEVAFERRCRLAEDRLPPVRAQLACDTGVLTRR